ncbi:DNA-binding transcriptional regulator, MocR family, contains an aminotransferase domain [Klenkia marina]|uniref:DNA-binding transcriptional regulator, MocR family, contains an aminotransferase domain n=1 Tax=Klenkia marina TaxID=1960309 RepID=A0A1G4XEN1_9ACTN|nr:PLP-dependent aminotransferase family protein [Klenkia marina]SCX39631.1 DNA-binding transcriptional regulator, MocR family, contains an aminotransferase domain [Klenkia marina]
MPITADQSTRVHELAVLLGDAAGHPGPRYAALANRVQELLSTGALPVGTRLPAERELAEALGVSRVTVASAYRTLREEGYAQTRHGSGTVTELPRTPVVDWPLPRDADGVINLAHAAPPASAHLLPAYTRALELLPGALGDSGYHPDGLPALRQAVADRFTARGLPTDPDQVVVTAGVMDAVGLVTAALLSPGDRVLVEHPTYPGAIKLFDDLGAQPVPVAVDPADPDALVQAAHAAARQSAPRMAYLMPDHSNPTGATLSATGRRRLAATLWQQGTVTLVDEVTSGLELDDETGEPPPFAAGVPDTATITVGGLSKSVWGGLRVGWLRTDAALAARLADTYAQRQLTVGVLDQLTATFLVADLPRVLADRRAELRAARDVLTATLAAELPDWTPYPATGGLALWCRLPAGLSSAAVARAALVEGVRVAEGRAFGTGAAFDDHLRLPFTRPAAEVRAALAVLARVSGPLRGRGDRTTSASVRAV